MIPDIRVDRQFDTDVLRQFESLGENCEFGLVQTSVGVDRPGFFRFNSCSIEAVTRVLETRFEDFDDLRDLRLEVAINDELIAHLPAYGFRYHTFQRAGAVDHGALLDSQRRFLTFLARKAREDLESGDKIFVRKDSLAATAPGIDRLFAALRAYGPNRLLWITDNNRNDAEAACIEQLAVGLLRGKLDTFCTFDDARTFSFHWFSICRAALRIFDGGDRSHIESSWRQMNLDASAVPGGTILVNALVDGQIGPLEIDGSEWAELKKKPSAFIPAAYCLMAPDARPPSELFYPTVFDAFRKALPPQANPVLLFRDRADFALIQSLAGIAKQQVPRLRIPPGHSVGVRFLLCPPDSVFGASSLTRVGSSSLS